MAYFWKWQNMSFPDILQDHVHDYYWNKCMQQIRSDMMEKPIHQHWGCSNLDYPKLNKSAIIAGFLILMNSQLSALSVEREDIIKGHAQML